MVNFVLVVCLILCIFEVTSLAALIYDSKVNEEKAYKGNEIAAKRLILPFYRWLYVALLITYAIYALVLIVLLAVDSPIEEFVVMQYFSFNTILMFSVTPVFLSIKSLTVSGFWNAFTILFPWGVGCHLLFCLSFIQGVRGFTFECLFVVGTSLPPVVYATSILLQFTYSRVQIGSSSNRNCVELLLVYSTAYMLTYIAHLASIAANSSNTAYGVTLAMMIFSCFATILFPWTLRRSLLADTKFWRGMGRHNQGLMNAVTTRESGIIRPSVGMRVVAGTIQSLIDNHSDIMIDFAYLKIGKFLGHGAASKVFIGLYKGETVAIKLFSPAELSEDTIDTFVSETAIASILTHDNIVRFIGICVRPPSLAIVMEYCAGGSLKDHIRRFKWQWTNEFKMKACLQATCAVRYLHSKDIIHRDIKAENFFVDENNGVKLGDFGESIHKPRNNERMSVLGTVAFMAPELVAGQKQYTEAIDIYALAITFWEIFTGDSPYSTQTVFQIYKAVETGERPALPSLDETKDTSIAITNDRRKIGRTIPAVLRPILARMWAQNPDERPSAAELIEELTIVTATFMDAPVSSNRPSMQSDTTIGMTKSDSRERVVETVNPIIVSSSQSFSSVALFSSPPFSSPPSSPPSSLSSPSSPSSSPSSSSISLTALLEKETGKENRKKRPTTTTTTTATTSSTATTTITTTTSTTTTAEDATSTETDAETVVETVVDIVTKRVLDYHSKGGEGTEGGVELVEQVGEGI